MPKTTPKEGRGKPLWRKINNLTEKHISFRRMEIMKGNTKETMWLTIRGGIIHIFTVTIFTYIMLDLSSQNYYTVEALESAFSNQEFYYSPRQGQPPPKVPVRLTFANVTNKIAFWDYLNLVFLRLYTFNGIKPYVLEANHILGLARLRQLRVDDHSCTLELKLRQFIPKCYGFFNSYTTDKKPFGLGTATAWVYSPPHVTGYSSYAGNFGKYEGGGYYVDLPRNLNEAKAVLASLQENDWISRQTRFVFIHICLYNSNTNNFWVIQLNFEFAPIGRILTSMRVHRLRTTQAQYHDEYFQTACRLYFVAYTIVMIIAHALSMALLRRAYLTITGHYVELASLSFAIMFICADCMYWYTKTIFRDKGPNYHYCADLQQTRERLDICLITGSITLAVLVALCLEYLDFGGSSPLVRTLLSALCDILSFSVVFLATLYVFSVVSYALFGQYVESMRGIPHAFFTLCNAVLRSFDYHTLLEANRTFAPIFFIIFTFLIIFVLCNLFIVILNDTYFDVRSKHSGTIYDFPSFLIHGFSNIARKFRIPLLSRKKPIPHGLSYQCVRALFHNAWVHWPEVLHFFNRPRVRDAAALNRIDEICVADVPRLKFGYTKEAYWEDFERLLRRMEVIRGNINRADKFLAPLLSRKVRVSGNLER